MSYKEEFLPIATRVLGKAFHFAAAHLPGGAERFYELFSNSTLAQHFATNPTTFTSHGSGIELVLNLCDSEGSESLDILLQTKRSHSNKELQLATWSGELLAYFQWYTSLPFKTIWSSLSLTDLLHTYPKGHPKTEFKKYLFDATNLLIKKHRVNLVRTETKLKQKRQKRGITQKELSSLSGVSIRAIQQYEQRVKDIDKAQARSVYKIAQAISCPLEDLLEFSDFVYHI